MYLWHILNVSALFIYTSSWFSWLIVLLLSYWHVDLFYFCVSLKQCLLKKMLLECYPELLDIKFLFKISQRGWPDLWRGTRYPFVPSQWSLLLRGCWRRIHWEQFSACRGSAGTGTGAAARHPCLDKYLMLLIVHPQQHVISGSFCLSCGYSLRDRQDLLPKLLEMTRQAFLPFDSPFGFVSEQL